MQVLARQRALEQRLSELKAIQTNYDADEFKFAEK